MNRVLPNNHKSFMGSNAINLKSKLLHPTKLIIGYFS